jgi:hypothetical protein
VGTVRLVAAAWLAVLALAVPAQAAESPLVVRTSAPATVLFGDRVPMRVTVTANRDEVDVSTIRVVEPLAPMTQLEPTRATSATRGPVEVVTYEVTAACLEQRCVTANGTRVLDLPPVRVSATAPDGLAEASASWPDITVRGRTPATARDSTGQFRTDLDPPRVTYRVTPDRTSMFLLLAAAGLATIALALAAVRAIRTVRRRNEVPLTELERALLLVRQSEKRPPADRRRAVGLLARVLGGREPTLAEDASTLAWSAREPTPDSVSVLVDDVGRAVEAR